jgi:general secretion pathway protein J
MRARPDGTRRPRQRPVAAQAGFTLVEVLIALSILAFMMTIAWSTTSNSSQAKRHFEAIEERNHEIRLAQARMVKDLSSAYLSGNEDQNRQERRTLFLGKSHGSVDELRFSSLGHKSLWAEANESEQTLIAYFADSDLEDRSKTNLLRRESRRLSNEPWKSEPAEIDVLLRDIEKVEFEYFDWRDSEWKEDWDTTSPAAQKGRLPTRVRITIEVKTEEGETVKYMTQARIMMQEELRFFAN